MNFYKSRGRDSGRSQKIEVVEEVTLSSDTDSDTDVDVTTVDSERSSFFGPRSITTSQAKRPRGVSETEDNIKLCHLRQPKREPKENDAIIESSSKKLPPDPEMSRRLEELQKENQSLKTQLKEKDLKLKKLSSDIVSLTGELLELRNTLEVRTCENRKLEDQLTLEKNRRAVNNRDIATALERFRAVVDDVVSDADSAKPTAKTLQDVVTRMENRLDFNLRLVEKNNVRLLADAQKTNYLLNDMLRFMDENNWGPISPPQTPS